MENSLAGPQKAQHRVAIWPRNFTPQHIFKRIENTYSHRKLNMNIHSSKKLIIAKKWTQPKDQLGKWKCEIKYPQSKMLFSQKKDGGMKYYTCCSMHETWKITLNERNKTQQRHILWMGKSIETDRRLVVVKQMEEWEVTKIANIYRDSFWSDGNVMEFSSV